MVKPTTFTETLLAALEHPDIVILSPSRIPADKKSSKEEELIVKEELANPIWFDVILASRAVESTTRFMLVALASIVSLYFPTFNIFWAR